ncbi:MAG TPA: hypothetical protein VJ932_10330 [Alkalispirochaeta sp.]|nr:hypothetical protein [Alkalispirochaeta sp.]
MSWWRSRSGFEVDLIMGDKVAVAVKAIDMVIDTHLKGIRAVREDLPHVRAIVVSQDETPRKTEDNIEILPWRLYLDQLA